jgi:peptidoglycan glycosyltransferase
MRSKVIVFCIFGFWSLTITGAFFKYALSFDPFFGTTRNVINRRQARGEIKDRNDEILVYGTGSHRKYVLGPAGGAIIGMALPEVGVEGFIEREFGERLMNSKKSKMCYLLNQNEEGYPLKTTLNKRLQLSAFQAMKGYSGALVIMKPNGEVLVGVSTPPYDPNKMSERSYADIKKSPQKVLFNRVLDGRYEPGSSWKTVIAMALLEKGSEGVPVTCNGQLKVGNNTITCMHPHGSVNTMSDALTKSCNIWFMKNTLAEFSSDDLKKSFRRFMSRKIEIDLTQQDLALAAIGQGEVLVSPMELAQLAASIANKGLKPEPRFVNEKLTSSKVTNEKTASELTEMMTMVVKNGTAKGLSGFLKKGYLVAAKTGTAERDTPQGKINTAVLIGFAGRKGTPEIAFSMVIEATTGLSGTVCVPVMKEVLAEYFSGKS